MAADKVPLGAPSAVLADFAYIEYAKLRSDVLETGKFPAQARGQIRPFNLGLPADSAALAARIEMDPKFRDIDLRPCLVSICRASSSYAHHH